MSYLVLARKYRPQTLNDVVEQAHVTRTLANAIASGRVAHAILFSGPRGTGKTTIARILAKAMNCEAGPAPVPCNVCRSCKEITSGGAVDVFEIDGASNNGVDHIRELRENIRYMPAHSRYKIYIIDEVHMLSTPAFNALLKTLEEPPAHVMFLFATTEPHKIPITILSRCQRHDLRRIDTEAIRGHMEVLCQQEGVGISEESLGLIAREAGGSMRDALSLLDQVMSCAGGEEITHKQVLDVLGVADRKVLLDMSACMLRGDVPGILDIIDNLYNYGHNLKEFYAALTEHFRNLLMVRMGPDTARLADVSAHELGLLAEQVRNVSEVFLTQLLDVLFKEEANIRLSSQPRLALEMAFIRAFQIRPALPIETLIQKLDELEKGAYKEPVPGASAISGPEPTGRGKMPYPPADRPQSGGQSREEAPVVPPDAASPAVREPVPYASSDKPPVAGQEREVASSDKPLATDPIRQSNGAGSVPLPDGQVTDRESAVPASTASDGKSASPEQGFVNQEPLRETGLPRDESRSQSEPVSAVNGHEAAQPGRSDSGVPRTDDAEQVGNQTGSEKRPEADESPAADMAFLPSDTPDRIWEKLKVLISEQSASLGSCVGRCALKAMKDRELEIEVGGNGFNMNRIRKNESVIRAACKQFFGREMALTLTKADIPTGQHKKQEVNRINEKKQEAFNHPVVAAALEIFDGTLVDVRIL